MTAVFAHRGFTDGFVENTLAAFCEARLRGADGVELDVRRTADGGLAVHHDAAIPGIGLIPQLTVQELPDFVPLLGDALVACEGMIVNVEIKNSPGDPGFEADHAIAADVAAAIADAGWTDRVIVSSFNPDTAEAVRAADRRLEVGWLLLPRLDPHPALSEARRRDFQAVHPFCSQVDAALVEEAHALGLSVNTWTVNDPDDLRSMVAAGVDALITDRLVAALAAVSEP